MAMLSVSGERLCSCLPIQATDEHCTATTSIDRLRGRGKKNVGGGGGGGGVFH